MLKQLIKANETGGSANQVAAALLTIVGLPASNSPIAGTPKHQSASLAQGADEKARVSED